MVKLKHILFVLRILISGGLIFFLYRRINLSEFIEVFASLRARPLILLFMLLFFNTAISALKWKMLLKADGIDIPWRTLTASYLVGSFFNMFLPSNIGGDAYRIYDVAQFSKRTAHSFTAVLADRLSGFVALVLFGVIFGVVGLKLLPDADVLWIPVVGMLGLFIIIGALFQQSLIRWFFEHTPLSQLIKLQSFTYELFDSVNQYRKVPGLFPRIMLVSFLFQFSVITCIYLLARGLEFDIPFFYFCVFVPFVSLMEALPISIFGLGIRDASYVFFFTRVDLPEVQALTLAFAYVVVSLVYALSGGVIFMMRPRHADRSAS